MLWVRRITQSLHCLSFSFIVRTLKRGTETNPILPTFSSVSRVMNFGQVQGGVGGGGVESLMGRNRDIEEIHG